MYGEKYDSFGGWYISTEISRKTKGAINTFHEMGRKCKEVSGMILSLLMIGFYFIFPQPECRLSSVRCQTGKHQIFIVIVEQFRFFS